jgi:hypothetical protein
MSQHHHFLPPEFTALRAQAKAKREKRVAILNIEYQANRIPVDPDGRAILVAVSYDILKLPASCTATAGTRPGVAQMRLNLQQR